MKPQRSLFIALTVLAMAVTVWAQPAVIQLGYVPAGGHSLGSPCDTLTAVPFPDATPISIFWDNNANGPDTSDQQPAIGTAYGQANANAFTFNGTAQHYGPGYFYYISLRIAQVPRAPDTALYYLRVNAGGTCWTTSDFYAQRTAQTIRFTWPQWTCADHPCGTGTPPHAPTNFSASNDTMCMRVHASWTHDSANVLGFSVYTVGVTSPKANVSSTQRSATFFVDNDRPDDYYVVAYNEWGQSDTSNHDFGSTYLIRFADGPSGNITGQRLANTNFTVHFRQPASSCPASIKLYLLKLDTLTHLWNRFGTGPLASDSLVMQMTGHFPPDSIFNCRLLMVDSSWDRHTLFTDTTDSVFHLGRPSAVDEFMNTLLPDRFGLAQNYPNPFNPETDIRFSVPVEAQVRIRIYNVMGQLVRTLTEQRYSTGIHHLLWNGTNDNGMSVGAGVYFYRMEAQQYVQVRKMLLLK
jgi:hypothetical protein